MNRFARSPATNRFGASAPVVVVDGFAVNRLEVTFVVVVDAVLVLVRAEMVDLTVVVLETGRFVAATEAAGLTSPLTGFLAANVVAGFFSAVFAAV